jgi:hypothetical protein
LLPLFDTTHYIRLSLQKFGEMKYFLHRTIFALKCLCGLQIIEGIRLDPPNDTAHSGWTLVNNGVSTAVNIQDPKKLGNVLTS